MMQWAMAGRVAVRAGRLGRRGTGAGRLCWQGAAQHGSTAALPELEPPTAFRERFRPPAKARVQWFPGHMAKGLRIMQQMVRKCDCVIEVHDARIPFTGRNLQFDRLTLPRVLVMTKADLADPQVNKESLRTLQRQGHYVVFTNSLKQHNPDFKRVIKGVLEVVDPKRLKPPAHVRVLVAGMPNVGKSSVINGIRRAFLNRANCARTGNKPGVTRVVQTDIKISQSPLVYLVDTPGVNIPNVENYHVGLKLAIIGTLKDNLVGEELIADYLLFTLNKGRHFKYVSVFGLEGPSDDIQVVLQHIARRAGLLFKGGEVDVDKAARHFVQKFRDGELGRLSLDTGSEPLPAAPQSDPGSPIDNLQQAPS